MSTSITLSDRLFDQLKYRVKQIGLLDKNFGYIFEFFTYLSYPLRRRSTPAGKFVIFGTGRSGSTLLVTLMNSNSNIYCDNEIYHRRVMFPHLYLKFRSFLGNKDVYGFKCLTYHLSHSLGKDSQEEQKAFLESLDNKGYKIIYLRRHNVFRQALSNIYARYRNQFHSNSTAGSKKDKKKMVVDLNELHRWMLAIEDQANVEAELLNGIDHLKLSYEDELQNPSAHPETFAKLSSFLGVDFEVPDTELKKVTPKSLSGFIENDEEVIQFLHEHGYEKYLEMA